MGTSDPPGTFGRLLRQHRIASSLTQEALAERSGLGVRSIQGLESGARLPQRNTLEVLTRALHLTSEQRARFTSTAQPAPRQRVANPHATWPRYGTAQADRLHGGRPLTTSRPFLPVSLTSFVGRARELARVKELLASRRLVTLTGPPGTGKTRLAQELAADMADEFAAGAVFVPLAPIRDPNLVFATIAQSLDVRSTGEQTPFDRLVRALANQQLLIVLDNFEQVVTAAPGVAEFLAATPGPTILITSRVALHVRGEQIFPVPSLAVPDVLVQLTGDSDVQSLAGDYAAIQLFVERARAIQPDFALTRDNIPAVVEICRQVDGLPLAIELAAARTLIFSPEAIRDRLEHRLLLLTGGPRDLPSRHQTLRKAIAWSYDLLEVDEQALFRRLSVFVGGCTLDAVTAVCLGDGVSVVAFSPETGLSQPIAAQPLDLIASLVSKSLLRHDEQVGPGGYRDPRFTLFETIREYAAERLTESGELAETRRRHAGYYLALAEQAGAAWYGPEQPRWLDRLESERDNLRLALRWHQETGDPQAALQMGAALGVLWLRRGPLSEGRERLRELLAAPGAAAPNATRALALMYLGGLVQRQGDRDMASVHFTESLEIRRALGDRRGEGRALISLGDVELLQARLASARHWLEDGLAVAREVADRWAISFGLETLGRVLLLQGELTTARQLLDEALVVARDRGDHMRLTHSQHTLGLVALEEGSYAEARSRFREELVTARDTKDAIVVGQALLDLASLAASRRDPVRALRLASAAAAHRQIFGAPLAPAWSTWYERWLQPAYQLLSKDASATAWAEGQAMTLQQAIALALEEAGL